MSRNRHATKEDEERRKRAKRRFLVYLRRLRRICDTIETADQWDEYMDHLRPLVAEHGDLLSPSDRVRLSSAMSLADASMDGLSRGCSVLQLELEHVAQALSPPKGGAGVTVLIGIVAVAAIVAVAVIALNATAAEVLISNDGCRPLILTFGDVPGLGWVLGALGIDLPDSPIASGEEAAISLPPVTFEIDGTDPQVLAVTVLGVTLPVPLGAEVDAVSLNGQQLLGERLTYRFERRSSHALVIRCGSF